MCGGNHHAFFGNKQENMLMQEWPSCFFWKRVEKHDSARVVVMFFLEASGKHDSARVTVMFFLEVSGKT